MRENRWRSVDPVWSTECNQVTMHDYDGPHHCPHIMLFFFCLCLYVERDSKNVNSLWIYNALIVTKIDEEKQKNNEKKNEGIVFNILLRSKPFNKLVVCCIRETCTIIPCNPFVMWYINIDQRISIVYLTQSNICLNSRFSHSLLP